MTPTLMQLLGALGLLVLGTVLGWAALARPAQRRAGEAEAALASAREALAGAEARAERVETLETQARERQEQLAAAQAEVASLKGALEAERRQHAARLEELAKAEERVATQFKSIASEVLGSNAQRFLELVSERFESHNKAAAEDLGKRQTAIEQMVKPLADSLSKFESRVGEIERAREGAYAQIQEQVKALRQNSDALRGETTKLVQALRAPKTRGRWGELQLRQVFEMAGMVEHVDFFSEHVLGGGAAEDGRLRPDALVKLPGGKSIVVDAKTPLDGFLNAIEASDPDRQAAALAHHARQLRTHVKQLAGKEYWSRLSTTPDFVVMFVPGEAMYSAAMEKDPGLFEDAFGQRVLIATPTTLIALIKAIAYGWQQEKLTENAQQVANNARDLYDRLSVMGGHMDRLGQALRQSVDRYNKVVGSLEARVLPAARRFETLGVAPAEAALETPGQVEVEPRAISASELTRDDETD